MFFGGKKYFKRVISMALALVAAIFIYQTRATAITEAYYFLVSPWQSSRQLKLEDKLTNARILELENRLSELKQQNEQLKEIIDYRDRQQEPKAIAAPVIGRSADRWWEQITLGKGSQDGIEPGFFVTGVGGVVGRVTQTTTHTSKILLISDIRSRIGVVDSRSRHLGVIKGKSGQTAVISFFEKVVDVTPGDPIATSPLSSLYPPGLPIGRVKKIDLQKVPAPEAEIELSAPLNLLEWVVVHSFKPQLETIE